MIILDLVVCMIVVNKGDTFVFFYTHLYSRPRSTQGSWRAGKFSEVRHVLVQMICVTRTVYTCRVQQVEKCLYLNENMTCPAIPGGPHVLIEKSMRKNETCLLDGERKREWSGPGYIQVLQVSIVCITIHTRVEFQSHGIHPSEIRHARSLTIDNLNSQHGQLDISRSSSRRQDCQCYDLIPPASFLSCSPTPLKRST